jgi:YVTN family beta-propeller protein
MNRRLLLAATALIAGVATAVSVGATPASVLLPTDRAVAPAGRVTPLQFFPTGAAVSPDGKTLVTIAGQPLYGASGTAVAIDVVDAASGKVLQSLQVGDAYQSVVYSRDGSTVYVAGGSQGVVHRFAVEPSGVLNAESDVPAGGFVSAVLLGASPQDLWVAGADSGRITKLDLTTGATLATVAAPNPAQLAMSADGSTLYASNWRGTTITAVDTRTLATRQITVGDHPSGIVALPDGKVVVANSDDASLATFDPTSTPDLELTDLRQVGVGNDSPSAMTLAPDGRLYVALAADDAVAVLGRPSRHAGRWKLLGMIPTGWYPTAVTLSPDAKTLYVVTGKGLAHSTAATAPYVGTDPVAAGIDAAYATAGDLETVAVPDSATLAHDTGVVRASLTRPDVRNTVLSPSGPIKHVIYITRENKTYDADLGDLHPGPENALVLFGQTVTPNLHALERTFAESQNFTYPAVASTTGHLWEDAGGTNDVLERANGANDMSDSWRNPSNYPRTGLLVQQAWKAGLAVRTYNEELAQQSGLLPAAYQAPQSVYPNYDLHVSDTSRELGWEREFTEFESHHCSGDLAATYGPSCSLPALEYVYLGEDHTTVVNEPGYPTIEAQVADNDYATARVIDAVSHSPDWKSTLVVVVEDDPQGTGDDVSAWHGFLAVASPWIRRGYISTVPYNLTSVVGAIDRVLGLPPLTDYVATSRPLDDLFTSTPDFAPFVADPSGVTAYPFASLPGTPPTADRAHGVCSFAAPDHTDPSVTNAATWAEVHGEPIPGHRGALRCG